MKQQKNAGVFFIFLTVLLDVIGLGVIIPVIPDLLEELSGKDTSEAAFIAGIMLFTPALIQVFFAPVLGELSDKYGRRPVLLIALFGLAVDYLFHYYAPTITVLFIGRVLYGFTGASITVANSYIADISTKENRAKNFGMIGAAFGLGFIVGPMIGAFAGHYFSIRAPFLIAAILVFVNFIYGLLVLPESLKKENRRSINKANLIPLIALFKALKIKGVGVILLVFFFINLAHQALHATWGFYTKLRFGWEELGIGISLSVVGILVSVVQGGLVGPFSKKYKPFPLITFSFIGWFIGYIMIAFSTKEWILYASLIPFSLGGFVGPTLQSVGTSLVAADKQGQFQGGMTSIMSLTSVLGPLIMTSTFYYFSKHPELNLPGAPYLLGFLLLLISLFILIKNKELIK